VVLSSVQLTQHSAALLNDLFGIQVRGGCMCAGPIVQAEMGINNSDASALEHMMLQVSLLLQALSRTQF
jgi:hypothetical protein